MKSIFKSLFILLFISQAFSANASHALGGEIYWECDPANTGKYIFYLQVLRDCGGGVTSCYQNGPTTIDGPFGAIQMANKLVHAQDISPDCRNSSIGCGTTNQTGKGAVELHLWKSNPITLNGTPPTGGWNFTWSCNARPGSLVNGGANQTYVLRAVMYPFTPVGKNPPTPNNANPCYDNSPRFLESPAITICEGPFTYNHLAADKDLDSLYFKWAQPWSAVGTPINWSTGYSFNSPFPSPQSNPANGPLVLDGRTGEVSMNIQSANTGSYASCFAVEAWRCGQIAPGVVGPVLIAEVYRDIAIILRDDCDPVLGGNPNTPPSINIDRQVYKNIKKVGNSYTTKVYPGDTVKFQFSASDQDFYLGQFQNITFTAAGLQVSRPLASGSGCIGPAPCATFSPVSPQTGYSNTLKNEQEFFWVPDCQHLGVAGNFCNPINKFSFSLRMQDDGCPAPEISLVTFTVEVVPGDPTPPPLKCLSYLDPSGDIRLAWDSIPLDSGLNFNYYMVLGSNTINGPYDTLSYVTDRDSLSAIVSGGSGYEHFYIQQSTGKCDFLSTPSDTLSLMKLNLTATPPGSAEYATLSWNALRTPLPYTTTGLYEIWTEAPAGSNNWSQVGSTPNLTFTDTVTVCNSLVNYQIRVTDTSRNCQSTSTLDSAHFSDKTNNDAIVLDSVSVNAGGNAIISWQPTKYADVVNYYLYFNDPKLGWIIVDTIPVGATMPHEWPGSQADARSEQFKVISVDSCGNQSDDQIVKPHASIFLRNYLNKCEAFSRISWNTYEGFGKDAVIGYKLLLQTNGGPWTELFTAGPQDTSYLQRNLDNGTTYCYRVQAIDSTGRTSTSNELCILAEVPRKSKVLYISQVTNDMDRDAVKIHAFIDSQADVLEFDLERAPSKLGPYRTIGTVPKPGGGATTISFNDYEADSDSRHYYYRLSATDSCGGRDTVSNLSRNILVQATARPNLTNLITWNPYQSWGGVIDRYEIYRKAGDEVSFSLAGTTAGNDTTFVDDISDYRETFGNFCYHVVAIEGANPLGYTQDNGQPFFSRSNDRCINQGAKVFMATAFRPGSDIVENRTYGPSMKFSEIEEYHFYIMNRWGVKVFETYDPNEKWDGMYQSTESPQGVYIYFLRYSSPGGVPQEERGDFTLIR